MVHHARNDEQQIGEAIDVDELGRVHTRHGDHAAFRPATDRARQVQRSAGRRPAGQDEVLQRRQFGFKLVDPSLEPLHVVVGEPRLPFVRPRIRPPVGQLRSKREEVALNAVEHRVDVRRHACGTDDAQTGIRFVDIAVGIHARIGLRHARPAIESGLAGVTSLCVDLHWTIIVKHHVTTRKQKRSAPLPSSADRQWFRRRLLGWYRKNGRDLPWRNTDNPYHILVSEVMLQQTQVDRVLPKYHEWLGKYPSFEALADASERDVVKTWYPLGYNIRPRRLQSIARESVAKYGGELPSDEATLLSFKGIGPYTAGAVMSFAFGKRAAILDTNVARVLFRVFIGKGDHRGHTMDKRLWELSRAMLPFKHVFDFNQALMDFGATLCTARSPQCPACPLKSKCRTFPRMRAL